MKKNDINNEYLCQNTLKKIMKKQHTYVGGIWLKPWSFTNNNLPFLMLIFVF